MGGERRKIQLELAFSTEGRGEAPRAVGEGTEPSVTGRGAESQVCGECLMEEVCERENVRRALRRVVSNRGAPGVDGVRVGQLAGHLRKQWPTIRAQLLSGSYQPQAVRRVEIDKPGGGVRKLGIPTVLDRFVQQAVLQVVGSRWDRTFSQHSYGFRPGRSAHQAVAQSQRYISGGYRWVVDIDLDKFFDRVNHDMLMGRVAKRVRDKRMLKLIRSFLNAGVLEDGLVGPTEEGTPQGGPLSPLLSNLVLDDLDRELERRGHRFVRYADDCNIYVRSERAGRRVMQSVSRFIERKLKLKVNRDKSAVDRPWRRKFLGFSFTSEREPRRRIAPEAVERFKHRVRKLTGRNRGKSVERMTEELGRYVRGWSGYFGFCETPSVLARLGSWMRRRLRSVAWKQWKRGRRRFEQLRRRGVGKEPAAQTAGSAHGVWRLSRSRALSSALPDAYFSSLGLPTLEACQTP